jgi:hypothetical protein
MLRQVLGQLAFLHDDEIHDLLGTSGESWISGKLTARFHS